MKKDKRQHKKQHKEPDRKQKQQNNIIEVHEIPKGESYTVEAEIILSLPKDTFRLDIRAWTYDENGLRTITSHYPPGEIMELIKEHEAALWEERDGKVNYENAFKNLRI